jgi:hypothetical protein
MTAKGNLPHSFVNSMVDVFLNEEEKAQTLSVCNVLNEQDLLPLHEAHILGKLSGQIGMLKGQLKLRKNALKLLEPESAGLLYKILFIAFFREYNIGYRFNSAVDFDWLQEEVGYVLHTLQQYADQWIDPAAHTEQWLHPMVLEQVEEAVSGFSYMTVDSVIVRTFIVPFEKWGLLEVERIKEGYFDKIQRIRKTPLFDAFIRFES